MSTNHDSRELDAIGVPELTPLGKRIELLRIERRMSKGVLAQRAGTSRQQLWRVMTGKSELTSSLCARLAEVLEIDSRVLRDADRNETVADVASATGLRRVELTRAFAAMGLDDAGATGVAGAAGRYDTLEEYVSGAQGLERTFATLPASEDGRRLKRAILNAIEELAEVRGLKLPAVFFELRRRVVNDEG
jgi:transcriptional regulator with XRE-family HTH domain